MQRLVHLGILAATVLPLVFATPIEFGPDGVYPKGKSRIRRQSEDVRDCDSDPQYLPDTAVITDTQLAALRIQMVANNLDAYIIPSEDAHQSEYIAEADRRRAYISGFDGSAGLAIVTAEYAAVWVDGRYFLQAKMQLDCNWLSMESGEEGVPTSAEWLISTSLDKMKGANLKDGAKIGFDPTLVSVSSYNSYNTTFMEDGRGLTMESVVDNLVDIVWANDKPSYPEEPLLILGTEYTGRTWQQKIFQSDERWKNVRELMVEKDADALIVHKLDEICWIFNLRGKDIPYNPMFISYAIIETDRIRLYLYDMATRATAEIRSHLNSATCSGSDCTQIKDYSTFLTDLEEIGASRVVWHSDTTSFAIYERVAEENRVMEASPILLMKARKNEVEKNGLRKACWMDSVSLCNLFGWIQEMVDNLPSEDGDVTYLSELIVEDKAIEYRQPWGDEFTGLSFRSISAFKDHGAIIHYSSSETTDVPITKKGTYMLDSGSQYKDGTTDITRTMHYGSPTAFEKEAYTRVLMGHIDLVTTTFRTGVYGRDIDAIAREPLWRNGLDYRHGTGHGIGHFLNVHEGPARISIGYRSHEKPMEEGMFFSDGPINIGNYPGEQPLQTGVFLSDEPGYYEDGKFGIRLENDMIVVNATTDHSFSTYEYMTFEMLSLVPFDPNLIDFDLMSPKQIDWYNAYHARIRKEIGEHLDDRGRKWMEEKTKPVEYTFILNSSVTNPVSLLFIMVSVFIAEVL